MNVRSVLLILAISLATAVVGETIDGVLKKAKYLKSQLFSGFDGACSTKRSRGACENKLKSAENQVESLENHLSRIIMKATEMFGLDISENDTRLILEAQKLLADNRRLIKEKLQWIQNQNNKG
uniref:Formamidopyrimidine-DNA glycosylase n=1 Tax=Lygus hesperus TaxID=30085 RepID=A0A0A9Z3V7_LYGHE